MRIAHISDTHLGFRAYSRQDSTGLNQREVDVMRTFDLALASVGEADPDIVLHTGDFFDVVRPSNHSIVNAFRRVSAFQKMRRGKPLVIVAGNHETPKSLDAGCILRLFGTPTGSGAIDGVFAVIDDGTSIRLPGLELLVLPTRGLHRKDEISLRPETSEPARVLAAHGLDASLGLGHADFSIEEFSPDEWSYVALGDYHVRKELGPRAAYSGSTDYTSSNIWEEIAHPKGWYLIDTESGSREFVEVRPVRPAIDLEPIDGAGLSGAEIGQAMEARAPASSEPEPIVRQKVIGVHPSARSEIPSSSIRELRLRFAHYRLDIQLAADGASKGVSAGGRSLEREWEEFGSARELAPGIDRAAFIATGTNLLGEATDDLEATID